MKDKISKQINETTLNGNILTFVATKEVEDRDGDIVYVDGAFFGNYMKNPLFLWAHDSYSKPIGKVVKIYPSLDENGIKQLMIDVEFWKGEEAQEIREMYDNGFLNAVSIRFLPKQYEEVQAVNGGKGYLIKEWELLEVSAVPIPANQEALIQKMLDDSKRIKQLEKKSEDWDLISTRLDIFLKKHEAGSRRDIEKEVESRIDKILRRLK